MANSMPEGIENHRVLLLDNIFGYLWKKRVLPKGVDLNNRSVAYNGSVAWLLFHVQHFFDVSSHPLMALAIS
jgi:hypothetical protein